MRVFFDGRVFSEKISGIPEYAKFLLLNLVSVDKENSYLLFLNSARKTSAAEDFRKKVDISRWRVPNRILDLSFRFLSFPRVDSFLKADVYFSPHFNAMELSKKAKRIVVFHDLSFLKFPEFYSTREKLWHWRQNPKRQAENASHIIAVSETTKNDLVSLFNIEPDKISVVYSGINPFFLERNRNTEETKKPKAQFFLAVGTIEPRKNISGIIRAFEIVKRKKDFSHLKLVIVGAVGWLCDTILKDARRSPCAEDIIWKGRVSYDELRNLYNSASALLFPSFFEGFGFPPLEAQALGCPVISSNEGSLGEVLGDSACVVNPRSVSEIASAMEEILRNNSLRERVIKLGHENQRRFRWGNTARRVADIIKFVGA